MVLWAAIVGSVRVSGVWQTDGCTPLYVASQKGHVEVVRALVGAGAAVNQARVREDWWVLVGLFCAFVLRIGRFVSQRACVASRLKLVVYRRGSLGLMPQGSQEHRVSDYGWTWGVLTTHLPLVVMPSLLSRTKRCL